MSVERQLVEATQEEKAAAFEWLRTIALGTLVDARPAAILLQELAAYKAGKGEEPDGEVVAGTGTLNDLVVIKWISYYHPKVGDKIYASPIAADRVSVPRELLENLIEHTEEKLAYVLSAYGPTFRNKAKELRADIDAAKSVMLAAEKGAEGAA